MIAAASLLYPENRSFVEGRSAEPAGAPPAMPMLALALFVFAGTVMALACGIGLLFGTTDAAWTNLFLAALVLAGVALIWAPIRSYQNAQALRRASRILPGQVISTEFKMLREEDGTTPCLRLRYGLWVQAHKHCRAMGT